ncbi:hypothetical protein D3C86_1643920 [compost metagenome]
MPRRIRSSVLASAWRIRLPTYSGSRLRAAALAGNSGANRPYSQSRSKVRSPWPARNSLRTSSNRREAGMSLSRWASWRIGAALCFSMSKPSLAAKRTARSMRTGSS